ncbi:hypothetical protein Aduo_017188 [Ancylostoma duodenale]
MNGALPRNHWISSLNFDLRLRNFISSLNFSSYQKSHFKQRKIRKFKRRATYSVSSMLMKQGAVSKVNDDQTSSEGFKAPLSATSTVKQEVDGLATQKEADLSTTSMIELAASSSKKLQASDIFYNVVPTTSPLAQEKEVVWTRKLTKTVTSNVPKRTKKKKSPKGKQVVVTRTSEEKEDFVTEE